MAEAEDVITDAARHVTVFARELWRRHRPPSPAPARLPLDEIISRLDVLVTAVFAARHPIRVAQAPARATLLGLLLRHDRKPRQQQAIPATNGADIWLPREAPLTNRSHATAWYRTAALQQAMRAHRGSAAAVGLCSTPLIRDIYLLLEAFGADEALGRLLPGMRESLNASRRRALACRPPIASFPQPRQPLERFVRRLLECDCGRPPANVPVTRSPAQSLALACSISLQLISEGAMERLLGIHPLLKDDWTGELRQADASATQSVAHAAESDEQYDSAPPRSARLNRRPNIREASENEDDDDAPPGPWMVQPDHGHEHAEDPMGLQRPIDRDDQTSAAEFGELVSELPEARLVSAPGRPREVLLSDDPPDRQATSPAPANPAHSMAFHYPEWDYRAGAYRAPGATVRLVAPLLGPQLWVDQTLTHYRAMLTAIRRQFEMLRAAPVILRKRFEGEDIDLEAYLESHTDFRAGLPRTEALYQTRRPARRSMAITLLVDISGSTDGWICGERRIIDVEREALLLVCIALQGLGEPYAMQAFSGEGPHGVTVRELKSFDERYTNDIARKVGALEPEYSTRAGAAIRHATHALMRQAASHRLLLLLSDGKPNDVDEYEGRYGVEDMRRAVIEARLHGVFPFCLTIDRQAASYLPRIFGAFSYSLLPHPTLLPTVLLDWMKRLLVR